MVVSAEPLAFASYEADFLRGVGCANWNGEPSKLVSELRADFFPIRDPHGGFTSPQKIQTKVGPEYLQLARAGDEISYVVRGEFLDYSAVCVTTFDECT